MRTNTFSSNKMISTVFNQYEDGLKEYVFSVKKRPFGMVTSPSLPVPTTTYIDFNLVDKLALPMTDIQYRKLTYCGKKMRIVGKISVTVQSVKNGSISENVHIKAFVVLDLHSNLDVDSVAGSTMAVRLRGLDVTTLATSPTATGSLCQLPSIHECAGDATTMPPTLRDSTTAAPAPGCRDDAQHEGVQGSDDAQREGVLSRGEGHP